MAAESFDIELRLINGGLIGPAKQSADVLRDLETQMDKTSSAFEDALSGKIKTGFDESKKSAKGFSDEVTKALSQATKLASDPKGFQMLAKAKKDLANQQKKLLVDAGVIAAPKKKKEDSFIDGLFSWAQPYGAGRVGSAAMGELIADGIEKGASLLIEAAHKVVDVVTEGFKRAFVEGSKYESLKIGYRLSLRGSDAQESMDDVGRFSKQTGFDDDIINKMLLPMRRAGASRQGARSAFAAATDIAAGEGNGGDQGRVQNLLEGFTHILLKGGVQERRLPEFGVDVKKFYADLASTLHVTAESAKKLAEEGKVNPQLLLNTIYKGVEQRQGGELGTGGIAYGKSMQARLSKLGDLPSQYLKTVAESPEWDAVSEKFGGLLADLDPDSPRGQKIVHSILGAFGKLADVIDKTFTAENIDHFVEGMTQVVNLAGRLAEALGPLLKFAGDTAHAADAAEKFEDPNVFNGSGDTWSKVKAANGIGELRDLFDPTLDRMQLVEDALKNGTITQQERNSYFGIQPANPSVAAAASRGGVNAPVTVNVNVGAGVDAINAKQVGQAVGNTAGQETSKHIGRIAQESGAR